MTKKYFTLIIVPKTTSPMKQLRVPYLLIYGLLVFGAFLLLSVPTVSYYMLGTYRNMAQMVRSLPQVRRETRMRRDVIKRYENEVHEMRDMISQLQRTHAKLTLRIGIEHPFTSQFGVGGDANDDAFSMILQPDQQNFEGMIDHKMTHLTQLKEHILSQQKTMQLLEEFFEDQQETLVSTPSIWPVPGEYEITSGFGMRKHPVTGQHTMHRGIDIGAPEGTPIVATADGIVSFSGERNTFGNVLVIDHGYGYTTFYGHCSVLEKTVGEHIKRGDVIARVGSTGRSTYHHLHYEIRVDEAAKDPLQFIVGWQ